MSYSVLIVDDHLVVREGLKLIIETNSQFFVIGEAPNGEVALQLMEQLSPDLILLDLNMPKLDGLATITEMNKRGSTIPVVILTTYNEDELMFDALAAGAKGYLLKDTNRENMFRTLEAAIRGETLLQPDILIRVIQVKQKLNDKKEEAPYSLTEKELIVLQAISHGYRTKEIAFDMGLAERTIKAHLTNIYHKLGVDSRSQAIAVAVERGIVHLD